MSEHFNGLTEGEAERLAILAEECGEVVKAIGKILRHGYDSTNPTVPIGERISNRLALAMELGDVKYAMSEMVAFDDIHEGEVELQAKRKSKSITRYLHHNQREARDDRQP